MTVALRAVDRKRYSYQCSFSASRRTAFGYDAAALRTFSWIHNVLLEHARAKVQNDEGCEANGKVSAEQEIRRSVKSCIAVCYAF